MFRPLLLWIATAVFVSAANAAVPPQLEAALEKLSDGRDRWAYLETKINYHADGTVKDETILRIDPSKPYPEQVTPIKIRGRAPTPSDLKKYRERGEKKAAAHARAARLNQPPPGRGPRTFASMPLDLENAVLHAEDETTATYRVDLLKTKKLPIPPEKCEILVRINKQAEALENISIQLIDSVRIKVIANVKDGRFGFTFTPVHSDHPPVVTNIRMQANVSVLFKGIAQNLSVTRSEYRRVRPYDERFEVQVGPAEILDF